MMRVVALILAVILATPATAQNVVPDTLDWRGYYPLGVGNVWEYNGVESPSLTHRSIVGDTLADGRHYYVLDTTIPVPRGPLVYRHYVRYDSSGGLVVLTDVTADSSDVPDTECDEARTWDKLHECVAFRSDFRDTLYARAPWDTYFVSGGYGGTVLGVDVAAIKCFHIPCCWSMCYAANIGWTEGGSLEYYWLTYARVGGQEYGTRRYTSIEPRRDPETRSAMLHPNPAYDYATLTIRLDGPKMVRASLFDLLGRQIQTFVDGFYPPSRHEFFLDTSLLPAGVYFVRLSTGGWVETRSLIVAR